MRELTVRDVLHILLRALVWIVLAALLAGAGAWYYYARQPDEYTAEAKLFVLLDYVDASGTVRYDVSTSGAFAGDFQELIRTPKVLAATAAKLGLAKLPEEAKIEVKAVANTRIINLTVTHTDRQMAVEIANALAGVFADFIRELTQSDTVSLASRAVLPEEPSGPSRARNTAVAALAALALGCGAALARELLNTKIRSASDVEQGLSLNLLSQVGDYRRELDAFRKKSTERSFYAALPRGAREQIKTLALNLRFATADRECRSIVFASATPQEGKSSLCVLLASEMAENGRRVLLVDMDFRKPTLGKYLCKRGRYDLVDYLNGACDLDRLIVSTPVARVDLVDGHHRDTVVTRMVASRQFTTFLDEASARYDLVLFDSPPLGLFVDGAMLGSAVDGVVLVLADNRVELEAAKEMTEQLRRGNANLLGVVLNLIRRKDSQGKYYAYRYYRGYTSAERDAD